MHVTRGVFIAFILSLSSTLSAATLPVWELGLGTGIYSSPHYLGAEQRSTYALPMPIFIYRGSYVQADRGGVKSDLYRSERMDIRISAGGALPVSSEDNDAREGMPDLDLMFEVGPTLEYRLWSNTTIALKADFPVRMAFALNSGGVEYQGLVSQPRLHLRAAIAQNWVMMASLGPMFADEKHHNYFYRVKSRYARADRPEYEASSGYTAMRYSLALNRFWGDVFVGAFVHMYDLHGAANEDSPLVKRKDYLSGGIAAGWMLKRSKARVWRPEPSARQNASSANESESAIEQNGPSANTKSPSAILNHLNAPSAQTRSSSVSEN